MTSLEKTSPGGFRFTENQSFCFETEGSLVWTYDSPLVHSPHHTLTEYTDRTPTA